MKIPAVTITPDAVNYISNRCDNGRLALSVKVVTKGCSGYSYSYELVDKHTATKFDEILDWGQGSIIIDAASVMYLLGSTLDIETNIMESHLIWRNPNSTNHCGCGESFGLKDNCE